MLVGSAFAALMAFGAAPMSATSPSPVPAEVQVTTETREQLARQVQAVAQKDGKGELARWSTPICPRTTGLLLSSNEMVDERIRVVAKESGAPVGSEGCAPNVSIIIASDVDDVAKKLIKESTVQITSSRWGADRNALKALQAHGLPVRWFYVSDTAHSMSGVVNGSASMVSASTLGSGFDSGANGNGGNGPASYGNVRPSRIVPTGEESFSSVIIIVDSHEADAVSAAQLSDYISMVALSPVRSDAMHDGVNTILNLFHNPDQKTGLTTWDRRYLSGLYRSSAQSSYSSQVNHIALWMEQHPVLPSQATP